MKHIIYTIPALMVCITAIFLGVSLCFTPLFFEVFDLHTSVLSFFNNEITADELRKENIHGFHFMPQEIKHFVDVKALLNNLPHLIAILAALIIISISQLKMSAYKIFQYAGIITISSITILSILYALGYWKTITRTLHPLIFSEGSWQFNSSSLIIYLYPAKVMQIGMATTLLTAIILTGAGWLYFYLQERRKNNV